MNFDSIFAGLELLLDPLVLIVIPLGCVIGIMVGALPGLSGGTALAIAVTFVPFLGPVPGIALMMAIYASDSWSGSLGAILLKVPGSGGSTAVMMDGYALTQQGKAGLAISVGRSAAFVGGVFGSLVLLFLAPVVAHHALRFGPAEFFALAVFGVTTVAAVSPRALHKALISALIGFVLACMGPDPITNFARFSFGSISLSGGVHLVWVIIGLFAVARGLALMSGIERSVQYSSGASGLQVRWSAAWPVLWVHKRLVALATALGTAIGLIPGAGSTMSAWIAYNVAKRTSKEPEKFGQGSVEGVIAPEAASDSVDGGSLVPTMTLAIPGSGGAAIILGGMILAGLHPGPTLFQSQAPQAAALMISFMLSQVFFLLIATIMVPLLLHILRIPAMAWPPIMVALGLFGAYVIELQLFGMYVALTLGIAAFLLEWRGFPLPPLLIGFVLGPILESNFRRVLILAQDDLVGYMTQRPLTMAFLILAVLVVMQDVLLRRRPRNVLV